MLGDAAVGRLGRMSRVVDGRRRHRNVAVAIVTIAGIQGIVKSEISTSFKRQYGSHFAREMGRRMGKRREAHLAI